MKKLATGILLAIVLSVGIFLYQKYRVAPKIKFNNLELTDLSGKPVRLEDFKGKKIFLNFFATWCGPCVREMPELDEAAATLSSDNFVFICISDEAPMLLNSFNARLNMQHVVMLHSAKKLHDLDIFTVPTNYLLNNKGTVVYEKTGVENWANQEMLAQLEKAGQLSVTPNTISCGYINAP